MPAYAYEACDIYGRRVQGALSGPSEGHIREQLRDDGLFVLKVKEQETRATLADWWQKRRRVGLADLVVMSQQLSTMIAAGLPLVESLSELIDQTENKVLREALIQVNREVQVGSTFSQALARHPLIFSPLFISLVHAGEVGGLLDEVLQRLAEQLDSELELRQRVKSAFVYPAAVMVVAIGVVTFLLTFVVPVFKRVYSQFNATLPLPTLMLMTLSDIIVHYWWAVGAILLVALLLLRNYLNTAQGKEVADRVKLRLPLLGKLYRKLAVARFTRTLASMLGAGVPLIQAMETSGGVADMSEITNSVSVAAMKVSNGAKLSDAIRQTQQFPSMVPRMIEAGEESGSLEQMLTRLANFFDRDIEHTVRRLTTLMEPLLTVTLGVIVGFIVVSMYMPIFTLASVIRR